MAQLVQPFKRIWRPNDMQDDNEMFFDSRYASNRCDDCSTFCEKLDELLQLFRFIEPTDTNLVTFSHSIADLYVLVCQHLEDNFNLILRENNYQISSPDGRANMNDYFRLEKGLRLSGYTISFKRGGSNLQPFTPFIQNWPKSNPTWWADYHEVKHDQSANLMKANLGNLLNAFSAYTAIMFAQFWYYSFTPELTTPDPNYNMIANRAPLLITHPAWNGDERYSFSWGHVTQLSDFKF